LLLTKLSPVTTLHGGPGGSGVSHYSLTGREAAQLAKFDPIVCEVVFTDHA